MKAICKSPEGLQLIEVPKPLPAKIPADHLLIRMRFATISNGDKAFINRPAPPGAIRSLHDIYGSSGAGEVLEIGAGVPRQFIGKQVTIYRSLHKSDSIVGCWSEYAVMHYMDCAIIPEEVNFSDNAGDAGNADNAGRVGRAGKVDDFAGRNDVADTVLAAYSGSLGNILTSYSFRMLALKEGHTGIISTAGTSATGITMLGLANVLGFSLISIVRSEEKKKELLALGAQHVFVQDAVNFKSELKEAANALKTTAVYDGIGGGMINKIIDVLPSGSTIYSYGFMGDAPLDNVYMRQFLFNGLSIKPFSVMATETVKDVKQLAAALEVIEQYMGLPHFRTKVGRTFGFSELDKALAYTAADNSKAVLVCG